MSPFMEPYIDFHVNSLLIAGKLKNNLNLFARDPFLALLIGSVHLWERSVPLHGTSLQDYVLQSMLVVGRR